MIRSVVAGVDLRHPDIGPYRHDSNVALLCGLGYVALRAALPSFVLVGSTILLCSRSSLGQRTSDAHPSFSKIQISRAFMSI